MTTVLEIFICIQNTEVMWVIASWYPWYHRHFVQLCTILVGSSTAIIIIIICISRQMPFWVLNQVCVWRFYCFVLCLPPLSLAASVISIISGGKILLRG